MSPVRCAPVYWFDLIYRPKFRSSAWSDTAIRKKKNKNKRFIYCFFMSLQVLDRLTIMQGTKKNGDFYLFDVNNAFLYFSRDCNVHKSENFKFGNI